MKILHRLLYSSPLLSSPLYRKRNASRISCLCLRIDGLMAATLLAWPLNAQSSRTAPDILVVADRSPMLGEVARAMGDGLQVEGKAGVTVRER